MINTQIHIPKSLAPNESEISVSSDLPIKLYSTNKQYFFVPQFSDDFNHSVQIRYNGSILKDTVVNKRPNNPSPILIASLPIQTADNLKIESTNHCSIFRNADNIFTLKAIYGNGTGPIVIKQNDKVVRKIHFEPFSLFGKKFRQKKSQRQRISVTRYPLQIMPFDLYEPKKDAQEHELGRSEGEKTIQMKYNERIRKLFPAFTDRFNGEKICKNIEEYVMNAIGEIEGLEFDIKQFLASQLGMKFAEIGETFDLEEFITNLFSRYARQNQISFRLVNKKEIEVEESHPNRVLTSKFIIERNEAKTKDLVTAYVTACLSTAFQSAKKTNSAIMGNILINLIQAYGLIKERDFLCKLCSTNKNIVVFGFDNSACAYDTQSLLADESRDVLVDLMSPTFVHMAQVLLENKFKVAIASFKDEIITVQGNRIEGEVLIKGVMKKVFGDNKTLWKCLFVKSFSPEGKNINNDKNYHMLMIAQHFGEENSSCVLFDCDSTIVKRYKEEGGEAFVVRNKDIGFELEDYLKPVELKKNY